MIPTSPPEHRRNRLTKPLLKRQLPLLHSECSRSTEHCSRSPGFAVGPEGSHESAPGHDPVLRLRDFNTETLRFLHDPGVPFTYNRAEQDPCMIKLRMKTSGTFRSP